uniref:Variant surface glycoprotein 1125.2071 n=1 Tax=Trypanosoma brucei TaxID=5691 RepID=A0A1J0R7T9_9TRYP|nr:variant surface glycoprotein 1125.2071 [Trypanosoma brucei]
MLREIAAAQLPSSAALAAQTTDCKLATSGLGAYVSTRGTTASIKWADGILTADASGDLQSASWSDNIPTNPSLHAAKTSITTVAHATAAPTQTPITTVDALEQAIPAGEPQGEWLQAIKEATGNEQLTATQTKTKIDNFFGIKRNDNISRPFTLMIRQLSFMTTKKNARLHSRFFFELEAEAVTALTEERLEDLNTNPSCPHKDSNNNDGTKENQTCSQITNPDECKSEVGCKYNETSQACEKDPKTAVAKTNQETEGKDGKTDCGKLTRQPQCEAVNKDGKKHCGWKKGGDSDTEKDTEKCGSSSIPLNKKLALMAAAFVSLVTL